jgi:small subunit ribosomal protein S6
MRHYELTFIVDPVLSGGDIKSTCDTYTNLLKNEGSSIVHTEDMGLRQLAYPINKRNSGIYYSVEFNCDNHSLVGKLELALRRDERIMRFLTVGLDKYGVKYNEDKRNGVFDKKKEAEAKKEEKKKVESKSKPEKAIEKKAEPKATATPPPVVPEATEVKSDEEE